MSIRIRPEQQQVLAQIPEQPFVGEVLARVKAEPRRPSDPAPALLEGWVQERIAVAHAHGITHQRHVWQLIKLSRQLGSGFEHEPWAQEILALEIPGGTKINALWHEVKRSEDPGPSSAD